MRGAQRRCDPTENDEIPEVFQGQHAGRLAGALSGPVHRQPQCLGWPEEGDRLVLRWQEKDGPPVTAPSRKGFGTRVIERDLAHELGGTVHLDYRADGVACTINFPAPRDGRDE